MKAKTDKKRGKAGKSGNDQKSEGTWPVTYKWVAMGTLVAYTIFGSRVLTVAAGQGARQEPGKQPSSAPEQAAAPPRRFDVPAGLLEDILPAFESASGVHVLVTNEGIGEIQSPGVTGVFTNEEALAHMLEGTRVSYRFTGPDLAQLDLTSLDQSVTVNASTLQLEQVASPKYTEPILDTPQSISVVPQQIMSEQNTTTLRDALRNVAGISLAAGEGGSQGDNLTIRGFTARNDIFLDGIRDFGSYYRDTFNQQEVQVLEGPSAITFGRGTTGGVVNDVSKVPEMTPFIQGNVTGGSDLTRRVALDVNEPLPQAGSGAAFRLNLMGNDDKVADRDIAEYRRYGFAPSLAFGLGTATRVVFSYFHQSEDDTPDYGIPWMLNGPAPVARNNYYGFQDANFLRTNDDIFTAKVEHDLNSAITLRNVLRYSNEARNAQITEPQTTTCATPPTPGCASLAAPLSSIIVTSQPNQCGQRGDLARRSDGRHLPVPHRLY
jgi:catecholate siderophore receptor